MASKPAGNKSASKKTQPPIASNKAVGSATPVKRRVDWDAVERDFRTAKFTLRELGAKYGVSHAAIGKKSRDNAWQQDLTEQIRQATNTKLTAELVSSEVDKSFHAISNTVQAAAEVNTRIILSHRVRLSSLSDAVETAKAKLLQLGDSVSDIREAATFVQAVGNLATATKTLIEQERKAFNLDDAPPERKDSLAEFLCEIAGGNSSAFLPVQHDPEHEV